MRGTENNLVTSRKQCRGDDDAHPPAKRRILTPARREQNRLAQKAYRERQKEEKNRIKKSRAQARADHRLRPLLKRDDTCSNSRLYHQDGNKRVSPFEEQPEDIDELVHLSSDGSNSDTGSNFPDVYLNMLQFFPTAFFGSCLANAASLGFDLNLVADCSAQSLSPFYQSNLSTILDRTALVQRGSDILSSFANTNIPEHLQPTMAQILIPHHISLDLIPLPFLRERAIMLSAAEPHVFNSWELKLDIYERGGLRTWKLGTGKNTRSRDSYPPWDMKSWEAAPWFLNKWGAVMGKEYEKLQQQSIGWQVVRDMISSKDSQVVNE